VTAPTPGQATYEAWAARFGTLEEKPFADLHPSDRDSWGDVAKASHAAETRRMRDVVCKLLDLFSMPDARRMRHASITAKTLERYAAEAGVKP
jgi:hypothetical protein